MRSFSLFGGTKAPREEILIVIGDGSGDALRRRTIGSLSLPPNSTLNKVRAKLRHNRTLSQQLPLDFRFLKSGGATASPAVLLAARRCHYHQYLSPVRLAKESTETVQGCLIARDTHTTANRPPTAADEAVRTLILEDTDVLGPSTSRACGTTGEQGMALRPLNEKHLSNLVPAAKAVYLTCQRLIQAYYSSRLSKKGLPNNSIADALQLLQDIAFVASGALLGTVLEAVAWDAVLPMLGDLENCMRRVARRKDPFSAWWFGSIDRTDMESIAYKIQSELRAVQKDACPEAHAVEVLFRPASTDGETLRSSLLSKTLDDLKTSDHAASRRLIGRFLGISDTVLIHEIHNLSRNEALNSEQSRYSTMLAQHAEHRRSEPLLFRHRQSMIQVQTSPLKRQESLEQALAPLHILDDDLVDNHMTRFHRNTRQWAIDSFDQWVAANNKTHRVFVLATGAGAGKTTIAAKLVRDRSNFVLAYHFCRYDDARFTSAKVMIMSLAYQISQRFPSYAARLSKMLEEYQLTREKLLSTRVTLSTLFIEFMEIPLHSLQIDDSDDNTQKFVIVIDGLDESFRPNQKETTANNDDSSTSEKTRNSNSVPAASKNEILDVIQRYFPRIPSWLNLYVTTRPMLPVLKRLRKFNAAMFEPDVEQNMGDIRTFFNSLISDELQLYEDPSHVDMVVEDLVHKSQGVFLYAAIVADRVRACSNGPNEARFVLENSPSFISGLYERQLDQIGRSSMSNDPSAEGEVCNDDEADDEKDIEQVRGSLYGGKNESHLTWKIIELLLAAIEPLSLPLIEALTNSSSHEVEEVIAGAPAYFSIGDDERVRFYHKSVKDWLLREGGLIGRERFSGVGVFSNSRDVVAPSRGSAHGNGAGGWNAFIDNVNKAKATLRRNSSASIPRFDLSHVQVRMATRCLDLLRDGGVIRPDRSSMPILALDEKRGYLLRHGLTHLCLAGMYNEARSLILDVGWLMARVEDATGLVDDCELIEDEDQSVTLIGKAVRLSLRVIQTDPRQLPSQLVGRLMESTVEGRGDDDVRREVSAFVDRLRNYDYGFTWWCPVSATWDQAEQAFLRKLKGHTGAIQCVSWCPSDHSRIASASWDWTARIWDILSGKSLHILSGHTSPVWSVAWSPNGQKIATAALDRTARIFDAATGNCDGVLDGHYDYVWSVAWSHDAKLIATGSKDKTIRLYYTDTMKLKSTLVGCTGWIYSVAWSFDDSQLVSASTENGSRIWDTRTGDCIKVLKGHTDWVRTGVFSLDGRHVYSGSADRTIRTYDVHSGECEKVLTGHEDCVWEVSVSRDGRHIVSASSDLTIRIWEGRTGVCEQVITGHHGPVWSVDWSPCGKRVVSASSDKSVMIWDAAVKGDQALTGHQASVWSCDLSSDGKAIASAGADKSIRLWESSTGSCIRVFTGHQGPVWSVAISSDCRRIASGSTDYTAAIYQIATGDRQLILQGHKNSVWSVAWGLNDSLLMTGSRDQTIRCWDTSTGECTKVLTGHSDDVRALGISHDGQLLASGSSDCQLRVWSMDTFICDFVKVNKSGLLCLSWSHDDTYIAVGLTNRTICVWNVLSGLCDHIFDGHTRRVNSVHFSPDSKELVSASTDKTLIIWNMETGEQRTVLRGHTGLGVYSALWSKDGSTIISGSTDKTIRVWNVQTGKCENVLTGHTGLGIYSVAWSADGTKLASGSRDRIIQIWNTDTGRCEKSWTGHTNWVYSVVWEKGSKRIISTSDDNTVRIWNVESGECEQVIEQTNTIPPQFELDTTSCVTRDMSQRPLPGDPVGVSFDKIQIYRERACAWKGQEIYFFKLRNFRDTTSCLSTDDMMMDEDELLDPVQSN